MLFRSQGACLVQTLDDLLTELPPMAPHAADGLATGGGAEEAADPPGAAQGDTSVQARAATEPATLGGRHPVLRALGHDPLSLEQLAQRTGWPMHELSAALLDLELEGEVARLPGARFQRRVRA